MKTLAGIALGFSMGPVLIGVIGAYAWASIHFKLSNADALAGAIVFCAVGALAVVIASR